MDQKQSIPHQKGPLEDLPKEESDVILLILHSHPIQLKGSYK